MAKVYYWPGSTIPHTVPYKQAGATVQAQHAVKFPKGTAIYNARQAPKPAAPRPAAPPLAGPVAPAPRPTTLPIDPAYTAAGIANRSQLETTGAGIQQQRSSGLIDYGFTEDPTTGKLAVDPNNPFSKAALLKRNYEIARRSSGQSMGASGQLYSGAFQDQQDFVNRGQLGAEDTLGKSLTEFLARNTLARRQAGTDYAGAMSQAEADRMDRIPTNPFYDPSPDNPAFTKPKAVVAPGAKPAPKTKPAAGKHVYYWPGSTTPHSKPYAKAPKAAQKAHAKQFPKAQKRYVAKHKKGK